MLPFSHPKDQNKKASWQKILSQKLRREPFQWKKKIREGEKQKQGKKLRDVEEVELKGPLDIYCVYT